VGENQRGDRSVWICDWAVRHRHAATGAVSGRAFEDYGVLRVDGNEFDSGGSGDGRRRAGALSEDPGATGSGKVRASGIHCGPGDDPDGFVWAGAGGVLDLCGEKLRVKNLNGDSLAGSLRELADLLRKYEHHGQADIAEKILASLETDDPDYRLLTSVSMWGGSGAVWEVRLSQGSKSSGETRNDEIVFRKGRHRHREGDGPIENRKCGFARYCENLPDIDSPGHLAVCCSF
jgi:hypothetical protein